MHLLGRRNFLRGLGLGVGSHLLGSLFRSFLPEAMGAGELPKRFVLYLNVYGAGAGHLPQPGGSETTFALGEHFAALESYRKELLLVNGLFNPVNTDLHGNVWCLSVAPLLPGHVQDEQPKPGGISLDRFIGRAIGKGDPWPSLNLTPIWVENNGGWSADGPGQHVPMMRDPVKAYADVFGARMPGETTDAAVVDRLRRDRSLLDFLRTDAARMRQRLAGPERQKLDQYLEGVRGMETRLGAIAKEPQVDCSKIAAPDPKAGGVTPAVARPEVFAAHVDIGTNALLCGLTHVVLYQIGGDYFPFLGEDGRIGHHHMWHDQGTAQKYLKFYSYQAQTVATIRKRLEQAPEGNGSVADQTLVMMFNEGGAQHHNGFNDLYAILLGSLGGRVKTGRYVQYPKMKHVVSDLFVSVAQALGVSVDRFGTVCNGPLPGVTA